MWILNLLIIIIAVLIIINKNSLWSVILLSIISVLISLSWLNQSLTFLGIILTIVYSGAVIILIIFVLFILDLNKLDIMFVLEPKNNKNILIILLVISIVFIINKYMIWDIIFKFFSYGEKNPEEWALWDQKVLGLNNYSNNVIVLVLTSILLLLSIWGPIILLL